MRRTGRRRRRGWTYPPIRARWTGRRWRRTASTLPFCGWAIGGIPRAACSWTRAFPETSRGRWTPAWRWVYFFSQAITPEEAEAEAAYILNAIDGYTVTYPIAFDWEPIAPGSNARTEGLDRETLTRCAAAFCRKVEEAGYRPAVYFNQTLGYLRYDLRELTDYDLWLAEYDSKPDFYYHFDLWQYSHTGQVAGIEGNVDLDLDLR